MMSGPARRVPITVLLVALGLLAWSATASAGVLHLSICGSSARGPGDGLNWSANSPLVATADCPYSGPGLELYAPGNKTAGDNATAGFTVTAPTGIAINYVHVVGAYSGGIGSDGWWGEFYWKGGPGAAGSSGAIDDAQFIAGGCCSQTNMQSSTIGWFIACRWSSCSAGNGGRVRGMIELDLAAEEDRAPAVIADGSDNLWYQRGWVRGTWPATFSATDPSGVCSAAVVFGSLPGIETPTPDTAPNLHAWQQCPSQTVPASVDTSATDGSLGRGEGAVVLHLIATNAAGVSASPSTSVNVDNSNPTISLSGPTDAPTTAGTQYVTATAGGSPSGIADIVCSVDGGPAASRPGATAQVPVTGIGEHRIACYSENNAIDPSGTHGTSQPATWSLKIGEPTLVGIAFDRLKGLSCHRTRKRVTVPGRWITVRYHGKKLVVKTRSHHRLEWVTRCHPRTVRRRTVVFIRVRRHGHLVTVRRIEVVRVVVPPRVITRASRVVRFGHRTTVDGWLGTSSGTALRRHTVEIFTAPDNGTDRFRRAATATTAADGSWSARLAAGPSRIVEAIYAGDSTTEAAASAQVHVIVPAKVRLLSVSPHRVPWGGTVHIAGRLFGGYLPPGGALVRLRIGEGSSASTYGVHEHVTGNGRFATSYTFGAGNPGIRRTFWFELASLPMSNYPWAPATSNRRTVVVGG
jgi:hypothetical protein